MSCAQPRPHRLAGRFKIPEDMNTEKTIKICGKDVIMRYCAGAETGYEILSGKSSDVFVPTVAERDKNGKPIKFDPPKAMTDDYIKLATAAIIAATIATDIKIFFIALKFKIKHKLLQS